MTNRRKPRSAEHGQYVAAPDELGLGHDGPDPEEFGSGTARRSGRLGERLLAVARVLAGVGIVIGAASGVAWGAYRYAQSSPRFAITKIEVEGAERLTPDQIARIGGVVRGTNIFALDTQLSEKRLLDNPWIEEVKVTRELPQRVNVVLREREAVALGTIGDGLYLVSRSGEPFKRLEEGDPHDLPAVTGISAENMARDRAREIDRIGRALDILRQYERVPLSKVHPAQELHLAEGSEVVLTVGKAGIALHLGQGPWRKKLLMAERVLGQLQNRGQAPGVVFLDNEAHPERVVVRMR